MRETHLARHQNNYHFETPISEKEIIFRFD